MTEELQLKKIDQAKEVLKAELQEAKQKPAKAILTLILSVIKGFIIMIIILYFISRPFECKTTTGETLKLEETINALKQGEIAQNRIKQCSYTIIQDAQGLYKALTEETKVNRIQLGEQKWQTMNLTPTNQ